MTFKRRSLLAVSTLLLATAFGPASAQSYPNRPVVLVVPYAAGGNGDFTARLFAEAFGKVIGQPVIVENRAGGGGAIGASFVTNAKPDGYTLLVAAKGVFSVTPNIVKTSYTIGDFTPISFISRTPLVLVTRKSSKFASLEALSAAAAAEPGKVPFGISATGSDNHVATLRLEQAIGRSFVPIAYKGSGPMLQDLLGGQIEVGIDQLTTSKPYIESGDFKVLAVLGDSSEPLLAAAPTLEKLGVKPFAGETALGVLGPRGLPTAIVQALEVATRKALEDPKLIASLQKSGAATYTGKRGEYESDVKAESDFVQQMVAAGKIQRD
ncbi:tripartite tricarboxylate transporter substrate binding protein [soil metagenome]